MLSRLYISVDFRWNIRNARWWMMN